MSDDARLNLLVPKELKSKLADVARSKGMNVSTLVRIILIEKSKTNFE